MPSLRRIEAYAIISADGMLADANRTIPDAMRVEADQTFFQDGLDRAALIVHGRHSHEGGPRAARRYRLVLTGQVPSLAPDPDHPRALLWNPAGISLEDAWSRVGAPPGTLAVIGGTAVYDLFLGIGYDAFHLSRVRDVRLPGGVPVFGEIGPDRTPEDVLADHGLKGGPERLLDAAAGATLVTWGR
jgi:hypothetical protein